MSKNTLSILAFILAVIIITCLIIIVSDWFLNWSWQHKGLTLKDNKYIDIDPNGIIKLSICDKCPPTPDDGNLHFCLGHEPEAKEAKK